MKDFLKSRRPDGNNEEERMFRKIRIWLIRRLGGVDFAKYKQALDTVGALCEKEQYLQEKIKQLEHKCNYAHYILERDDSKY